MRRSFSLHPAVALIRSGGMRLVGLIAAVALLGGGGSAVAQTGAGAAREALEREFPGVVVIERGDRARTVFGRPMTTGATAREAMEDWMFLYGDVFGVDELEWVESRASEISHERVVFALPQEVTVEGGILAEPTRLRVEGGRLRALVAPVEGAPGESFAVTYVSSRIKDTSAGIAPPLLTGAEAIAAAGRDDRTEHLESWREPELVVIEADLGLGAEVFAAWRLVGRESEQALFTTLVVHVDAATAEVVRVASGIDYGDSVTGVVKGGATSGFGPPFPEDTVEVAMADLLVEIVGESSTLTDTSGAYALDTTSSSVDVLATLESTYWITYDYPTYPAAVTESLTGIMPPASGVNPTFNETTATPPTTQAETAIVNVFLNIQKTTAFFDEWAPGWRPVDFPTLETRANAPCSRCHAGGFGAPGFIVLCAEKSGPSDFCNNGGYSTWVSHEYGHYIHRNLIGESASTAHGFSEGYGDSLAMLVHDTGVIGKDYLTATEPPQDGRSPSTADITYPECSTDEYIRGLLLGRLWWDIRTNITPPIGVEPIDAARLLFVDWTLLTSGSADPHGDCTTAVDQPADGDTFIEVLVADDTDGDLSNGTPNEDVICAAFAARGIDLPANVGACEESAGGGGCRADLNFDGALDFFDFLKFQDLFGAADPRADFTGDGSLDFFDFLGFENAFAAGCW